MHAAVIESPQKTRLHDVPVPEPKAHEVLVRLEGCGLCGSDLASWEGRDWFDYPLPPGEPGHEAWGTVERVGTGVRTVRPGDRVAGLFHEAFAEHAKTHQSHLLHVPERLDGHPFAGEPLACAANAVRRSGIQEGDTAVVVGVGFIGAAIAAFARASGAHVIAASRRRYARDVATHMGAQHTFPLDEETITGHLEETTTTGLADVVFEVTGKQAPLELAGRLARIRGRLVIAGFHQDGPRSIDMQLWNWRGLDVVNAHEREPDQYMAGMRHAAQLVSDGMVDLSSLYTHRFPLQRLDEAFTCMQERPDGFLKAVIEP